MKRKPFTVFLATTALAVVAFIPTCSVVMGKLDANRFGVFHYLSYDDVQDSRVYFFLPPSARSITVEKTATGHRAKYLCTKAELDEFVDSLWEKLSAGSATERGDLRDGEVAFPSEIEGRFRDLDWPPLSNAIFVSSPYDDAGGGATYFCDVESGTVYHYASYF